VRAALLNGNVKGVEVDKIDPLFADVIVCEKIEVKGNRRLTVKIFNIT
jgi:hypothetical protein